MKRTCEVAFDLSDECVGGDRPRARASCSWMIYEDSSGSDMMKAGLIACKAKAKVHEKVRIRAVGRLNPSVLIRRVRVIRSRRRQQWRRALRIHYPRLGVLTKTAPGSSRMSIPVQAMTNRMTGRGTAHSRITEMHSSNTRGRIATGIDGATPRRWRPEQQAPRLQQPRLGSRWLRGAPLVCCLKAEINFGALWSPRMQ